MPMVNSSNKLEPWVMEMITLLLQRNTKTENKNSKLKTKSHKLR